MTLYRNRYRVKSTRLPGWVYTRAGYYFVTICTKNHLEHFGEIATLIVRLSPIGEVACSFWEEIPTHFPNVTLDEYIIMPNHVHGIIIIRSTPDTVETQYTASLQHLSQLVLSPGSLSAIVRSYKSAVTRWTGQNGFPNFAWQPRFYDHIIRDEPSLNRIRAYIRNNPSTWDQDRENPRNR